jgi:hypothetical protein
VYHSVTISPISPCLRLKPRYHTTSPSLKMRRSLLLYPMTRCSARRGPLAHLATPLVNAVTSTSSISNSSSDKEVVVATKQQPKSTSLFDRVRSQVASRFVRHATNASPGSWQGQSPFSQLWKGKVASLSSVPGRRGVIGTDTPVPKIPRVHQKEKGTRVSHLEGPEKLDNEETGPPKTSPSITTLEGDSGSTVAAGVSVILFDMPHSNNCSRIRIWLSLRGLPAGRGHKTPDVF